MLNKQLVSTISIHNQPHVVKWYIVRKCWVFLFYSYQRWLPTASHFFVTNLSSGDGVIKLLEKVNPTKATVPDLIPARILKGEASAIAPFLTLIFQQSIGTGTFPRDWTIANITAIFRARLDAANYRPVSLTSILCRILEHIIFYHIMAHLDEHNILNECKYMKHIFICFI